MNGAAALLERALEEEVREGYLHPHGALARVDERLGNGRDNRASAAALAALTAAAECSPTAWWEAAPRSREEVEELFETAIALAGLSGGA